MAIYHCEINTYITKYTIFTFPTLNLKLCVLLELFAVKAGKRVRFHVKFNGNNIYMFAILA